MITVMLIGLSNIILRLSLVLIRLSSLINYLSDGQGDADRCIHRHPLVISSTLDPQLSSVIGQAFNYCSSCCTFLSRMHLVLHHSLAIPLGEIIQFGFILLLLPQELSQAEPFGKIKFPLGLAKPCRRIISLD